VCNAFAEGHGASHPAAPGLLWHVWDSARCAHMPDASVSVIVAPAVVEVQGRDGPKENVGMNGTYHLFGMHAGRPAYMKADGSGHSIRYWPREDRWLIDFDGLRNADVCNAYAESQGAVSHPVELGLSWNVWESAVGRHLPDPSVRAFVAPHWVRVSGRDRGKENTAINGDYTLVALVEGKAAYKKEGSAHVIRYWRAEDRWIIDLEHGFSGGDVANAYADAKGADNPGNADLIWHVWDTGQMRHVVDDDVIAEGLWHASVDWARILERSAAAGPPAPPPLEGLSAVAPSEPMGGPLGASGNPVPNGGG